MCYDMSFFSNIKLAADYLRIKNDPSMQFDPTYHVVAQSFRRWPVAIHENETKIGLFEWGLIADYMNTPEKIKEYRTSMANARSEKLLDDKRSVWHRLRDQRCLVFSTGFFEHHDTGGKKKQPYFIKVKGEPVFCMAGLYNYSPIPDPETGELIGTFTIITRDANPLMAKIHNGGPNSHRMPAILPHELALEWIKPGLGDETIRSILTYEISSEHLEAWPVNTIRTRKPDDETVIALKEDAPPLP